MICPKCNVKLNDNSKYCPKCGELFEMEDVKKYSKIFETELLEVYYPNKSYRLKWWGVSLRYALYTYFYAIYHKMYRCAFFTILAFALWLYISPRFVLIFFNSYGSLFYPLFYILFSGLLVYVFYIFRFDKLLLEKRKEKLNRIVRDNPDKTKKELIKLVEEDKKGNVKGVIIALVITVIVLLIAIL